MQLKKKTLEEGFKYTETYNDKKKEFVKDGDREANT